VARVALPLLLFLVVGQGASAAHQIAVRHATCAAHGESLHGDAAARAHDAASARAALESLPQPRAGDHDDHCVVALGKRVAAGAGVGASAHSLVVPPPRAFCIASASTIAVRDALDVAPKTSPPL
jgi:hypothetical protein